MIYFDNAATTFPKPRLVARRVEEGVRIYGGNPGRSGHALSMRAAEQVFCVREMAAELFGAPVEQVVFTSNCTHALNLMIKGVMAQGGHMVITNLEHNSVLRPTYRLARDGMADYTVVDVLNQTDQEILDRFDQAITPETRLLVCTHASNVTGQILPVQAIGRLCRERGILFGVDGAQSAGILPCRLDELGADFFCTAGHKGLYGPTGTGLLVLRNPDLLTPLMEGGTGSNSYEQEQPDFYPDRLEAGTLNSVGICGLGGGIQFVRQRGISAIYRHEMALCRQLWRQLRRMPHVILYDQEFLPGKKAPVLLFNIRGISSMEAVDRLSQKGFALRGGLHCAPLVHQALGTEEVGGIRFSPSAMNCCCQVRELASTLWKMK